MHGAVDLLIPWGVCAAELNAPPVTARPTRDAATTSNKFSPTCPCPNVAAVATNRARRRPRAPSARGSACVTEPSGPTARATHWDDTYAGREVDEVSWFQAEPHDSLELIDALDIDRDLPVIDIGGGASSLVDRLVARGFTDLTVLDVSEVALRVARTRLGDDPKVEWITSDVLEWEPERPYGLWHDRAVFHFLIDPTDRAAYLATMRAAVPSGAVVLATFAPDGPDTCSGLPVARYDPDDLAGLLEGFDVIETRREVHVTPWGTEQPFSFVAARRARAV